MQNRRDEIGGGERLPLAVGDRHQRKLGEAAVDAHQILDVEAAVQRGHAARGHVLEKRKLQHVGVKMDDVEIVRPGPQLRHLEEMGGEVRVEPLRVEPDGLIAHRVETGGRAGIGAGEQRHIVAESDQRLAQEGDDALGAAV